MITLAQTQSLRLAHGALQAGALADLQALLNALAGADPESAKRQLFEAFPEVFDPYALAVSDVSATFYEEARVSASVRTSYAPRPLAVPVERPSWNALVGLGTSTSMFEQGGALMLYSLFSGGLTKRLTETGADTIAANASLDTAPVSYQRVPSPGCCAWCGMLASRGAAYGSRESAGKVIGRGVPVEKTLNADGTRKSGGQARGIKARGKRPIGEDFHDACRCSVVPVFSGNEVQMQADADRYYDQYRDASDKINSGLTLEHTETKSADGSLKRQYTWVHDEAGPTTPDSRTKMIVASMRQELDVR